MNQDKQDQIEQEVKENVQLMQIEELNKKIAVLNETLETQTKLFNEKIASLADNYLTNSNEIKSSIQELKKEEPIDDNDDRYNF